MRKLLEPFSSPQPYGTSAQLQKLSGAVLPRIESINKYKEKKDEETDTTDSGSEVPLHQPSTNEMEDTSVSQLDSFTFYTDGRTIDELLGIHHDYFDF